MFGYKRNEDRPGASSDKIIAVSSELRLEAQYEAKSVHGLNYDHTTILYSTEASTWLNRLLAKAAE